MAAHERALAEACGAAEAVAVSNCTAALHLALLVLGVGPGVFVVMAGMVVVGWLTPDKALSSAETTSSAESDARVSPFRKAVMYGQPRMRFCRPRASIPRPRAVLIVSLTLLFAQSYNPFIYFIF